MRTLGVITSLFPDALPCIQSLRARAQRDKHPIQIGIMSNGFIYKDLLTRKYPDFMNLFDFWIQASDVGALKPSNIPFIACINASKSIPRNILYVGDTYSKDIIGGREMNIHTCWLNRTNEIKDMNIPKNEVYISSLNPIEFEAYIDNI